MKRPTPESVSVTPAIRKPRIATAARPPAPKEQHAQFAAEYGDALGHDFTTVGHMMITALEAVFPLRCKG